LDQKKKKYFLKNNPGALLNVWFDHAVTYYYYVLLFIFNCNWVDTRWQQCSTHLHTNSTQNTENVTNVTMKGKNGKCGPCTVFASYTLAFVLQLRKNHGKTSVRVVEKCPDIPVAVVQYTFTHKQYTKQRNETEYTERNIHNNKNT
jgi:hypothetical protein